MRQDHRLRVFENRVLMDIWAFERQGNGEVEKIAK
jgi:hypothetical protein